MVYLVSVKGRFSAAHRIESHPKCKVLHGHNWDVEAVFEANELNHMNMVAGFKTLKTWLLTIIEKLDHPVEDETLNDLLREDNLTAEFLAEYIYDQIKSDLNFADTDRVRIKEVTIWETPDNKATYREE